MLERAHRSMAASLALAPWSAIWTHPGEPQQAGSSADLPISHPDRITEHATDAILKLVTSETCTYDSMSRRFVGTRKGLAHLPVQQESHAASESSTPRHADPNSDQTAAKSGGNASGSSTTGSKICTAVEGCCGDSMGDAELAAFMRLCGESLGARTVPQDELQNIVLVFAHPTFAPVVILHTLASMQSSPCVLGAAGHARAQYLDACP